jgi:hypothetical protein
MKIFVPFTKLPLATAEALKKYDTYFINMVDSHSYFKYFVKRWKEKESFINVEHDIVPWPGAIDEIEKCQQIWCGYGYNKGENIVLSPYLGCVKIGAGLIELLPGVWNEREKESREWGNLDVWLGKYAWNRGIKIHQHYPSVNHFKEG